MTEKNNNEEPVQELTEVETLKEIENDIYVGTYENNQEESEDEEVYDIEW